MSPNSILDYLDSDNRNQSTTSNSEEELSPFKSICCMKYAIEKQCKRCPFKQIENSSEQSKALKECREQRRGSYHWQNITIEYNSKYW